MTERTDSTPSPSGRGADAADEPQEQPVVVIGPDGQPVPGLVSFDDAGSPSGDVVGGGEAQELTELVSQPAKVMRIGSMIKQLLDEVKSSPLDEASRLRLRDIHARSIQELEDGLAPELVDELERLSLPFDEDQVPTEAELRIAQAQLVGWLEGLFHGIQTALFAQQMAARAQFEEMRRHALPPGMSDGGEQQPQPRVSGPYL